MRQAVPEDQIPAICRLIYSSFQVPSHYVDKDLKLLASSADIVIHSTMMQSVRALLEQCSAKQASVEFPSIQILNALENVVILQVERKSEFAGYMLIGPSVYTALSAEALTGILQDDVVPLQDKEEARNYYASLPVINGLKLLNAGVLLYYLLYREEISVFDILQHRAAWTEQEQEMPRALQDINRRLSSQREASALHHDVTQEKQLFDYIKEGQPEQLRELVMFDPDNLGVLSKRSHLRSQKNLTVAAITLATRAAIEGGLHPEIAFTMSDLYIQQMEEQKDARSVVRYRSESLLAFAERVKHNQVGSHSRVVTACQRFIYNHIYEELTVAQLAEKMHLNANYLSQLFKKETGLPIHAYILQEKVEEAKKLLLSSELTLSEIWARLHFYDQSHFTKTFKKHAGVTPKKYRSYAKE
ncbi:helix-turn-helix domain-containing protein [Paenibacillus sinopodophylli]|uniref:helix-turn-helix domain-containing protein n=1 Tax=Paenibacillus sinopodophylli TaxID=1837342 RepID=UPI001486DB5B|nr:helix-turn-helix domain-containing protein [Paenibacillus sinopodophylli]